MPAQRIGFQLEKIVNELEQLQKQIAKRESGMQTIFSAMHDALLVVDSNRQVILTNQTFRKLFDAPEISVATPLLEIVRDPTLDRLLTDAFRGDGPVRCELTLDGIANRAACRRDKERRWRDHRRTGFVSRHHRAQEDGSSPARFRGERFARIAHAAVDPARLHRDVTRQSKTPREELTRILRVMERHSDRLELLVEDLLTLAQLESGNPNLQMGTVDLSSFLPEMVRDWEKEAHKQTPQHDCRCSARLVARFALIARGYRKPSTICSITP